MFCNSKLFKNRREKTIKYNLRTQNVIFTSFSKLQFVITHSLSGVFNNMEYNLDYAGKWSVMHRRDMHDSQESQREGNKGDDNWTTSTTHFSSNACLTIYVWVLGVHIRCSIHCPTQTPSCNYLLISISFLSYSENCLSWRHLVDLKQGRQKHKKDACFAIIITAYEVKNH